MPLPDNKAKAVPPTPEEKLDKILKKFGDTNKTADNNPGEDLRKILDDSPDLKKRILDSVDKGFLTNFKALPPNSGMGGSYESGAKAINLPMDVLKEANTKAQKKGELVFVMGHEIQHSFNAAETKKTTKDFLDGVETVAKNKAGPHDYTKLTGDFIEASRKDEASAHIGGFNAIVSQAKKANPDATLKDIYKTAPGRMDDFITVTGDAANYTYTMKPGLTLNADMTMPYSKDNVAAMGEYYFNKAPDVSRLGAHGNLDYTNYYGSWAMNVAGDREKAYQDFYQKTDKKYAAPEVHFDMKQIGLKEDLIKQNVKFADHKAFSYVDTSDGNNTPKLLNPVANAKIDHPDKPVAYRAELMAMKPDAMNLERLESSQRSTSVSKQSFEDMAGGGLKLKQATTSDAKPDDPASPSPKRLLMGDDLPSSRMLVSVSESLRNSSPKPGEYKN
ncbi:hypothetical protein [Undibacterium sp. TS12]|uniref:hypothetical protein n=1 Tax=Undibacterium sp. TS12 TaxID=2908202 RepID=UPI001F4C9C01|nr:hypothetical protein [Undibacterium sp. TS12]MCH8622775.1 hypothetical protein [Undibacterium sp. TS12]